MSRSSRNFIDSLPEKQRNQVLKKIANLRTNPSPHDRRSMTNMPGYDRLDVGEYRMVLKEQKTTAEHIIQVVLVDRRNDGAIYRALNRLLDA